VEIPGTVDMDQRGHIFGACLKPHEDTLSCNDILHAVSIDTLASSDNVLSYKPCHAIFDHAWVFLHSTSHFMLTATSIPTGRGRTTWLESSDEDNIELCLVPTGASSTIDAYNHGQSERIFSAIGTRYAHFMSDIAKNANLMADSQNFIPFKNDLRRLYDISEPVVTEIARELLYDEWEKNSEGVIIENIKDVYRDPYGIIGHLRRFQLAYPSQRMPWMHSIVRTRSKGHFVNDLSSDNLLKKPLRGFTKGQSMTLCFLIK